MIRRQRVQKQNQFPTKGPYVKYGIDLRKHQKLEIPGRPALGELRPAENGRKPRQRRQCHHQPHSVKKTKNPTKFHRVLLFPFCLCF